MRISNHFLPVLLVCLTTGCTLIADVDRNDILVPTLEGGTPEDDGGSGGGGGDAATEAGSDATPPADAATGGGPGEAGPESGPPTDGGNQPDAEPPDAAPDAPTDAAANG